MRAFLEAIRLRLIDDCRAWWRLWTVRLHLVMIASVGLYELVPAVPAEIAALIPAQYRPLLLGLYAALGIALRLIKQKQKPNG